jgi:hypothetical protein
VVRKLGKRIMVITYFNVKYSHSLRVIQKRRRGRMWSPSSAVGWVGNANLERHGRPGKKLVLLTVHCHQ